VRKWRRELHKWDPEASTGDENDLNAANVTSIDLNDLLDLQQLNDCAVQDCNNKGETKREDVATSDNKPKKSWADLVDEELNQTSTGKSIYDDIDDDDF